MDKNKNKNKIHIYAAYKRLTSDPKTFTDWKWRVEEIFHANGSKNKAGVAILISDKINIKIKTVTKKGVT